MREPLHRSLDPLIAAAFEGLESLLQPPYALFGHSMGAVLAFEFARRLRKEGWPSPTHLVVSGRIAPQLPSRRPPVHALPDAEFRTELEALEGTPAAVLGHDELMQLLTPILRADFAVSETYIDRGEPALGCPITAVGGIVDPWVTREELEGWTLHTTSAFACYQFPGNHFFLQSSEAELLSLLGSTLLGTEGNR